MLSKRKETQESMNMQKAEEGLIDPIAALVASREAGKGQPIPLAAVAVSVTIQGGLALVETKRTFRNQEKSPIEALLTIPVPVQATFFGLTARIGERVLHGIAQGRSQARETYEEAVEEGQAAVLHEEVLRGIHSLSVANLAAGATVEVSTRWTEVLRCAGSSGRLRIPMTVGEVYGSSGLPEVDDLVHGGAPTNVPIRVRHNADGVRLAGVDTRPEAEGLLVAEVPSNVPIDLQVETWKPGLLKGRSRDGKAVEMRIEPAGEGDADLNLAVLVDHSGSMYTPCSVTGTASGEVSSHESVRRALSGLARKLRPQDRLALWEFDNVCEPVGTGQPVAPAALPALAAALQPPRGGTEIGRALEQVIQSLETPDLLLITDGLSYDIDVQRIARSGRRIFVLLVGEDSLEAMVGHLAALTGGDVHCTFRANVAAALDACLHGLRTRCQNPQATGADAPKSIRATRCNANIEARWLGSAESAEEGAFAEAVAAHAAGLALGALDNDAATRLAVREGLVTHLTSLVLVDRDGEKVDGLPVTRKAPLPTPPMGAGQVAYCRIPSAHSPSAAAQSMGGRGVASPQPSLPEPKYRYRASRPTQAAMPSPLRSAFSDRHPAWPGSSVDGPELGSKDIALDIDWNGLANALVEGNLDSLDEPAAEFVRMMAGLDEVQRAATDLGMDPVRLVIAWLASSAAKESRHAKRVARRMLKSVDRKRYEELSAGFDELAEPVDIIVF